MEIINNMQQLLYVAFYFKSMGTDYYALPNDEQFF